MMRLWPRKKTATTEDGYELDRAQTDAKHEDAERTAAKNEESRKKVERSLARLRAALEQQGA